MNTPVLHDEQLKMLEEIAHAYPGSELAAALQPAIKLAADIERRAFDRLTNAVLWQQISDVAATIECDGDWKGTLFDLHKRLCAMSLLDGGKLYIVRRLIEAIFADEAGVPIEQLPYKPRKGHAAAMSRNESGSSLPF